MWAETQRYATQAAAAEGACRLGDALCRDSLAWARTIAVSVSRNDSSEELLFEEVLAYAISLAEFRYRLPEGTERNEFWRLVRDRTAIVTAGMKWRRTRRRSRLAAPAAQRAEGGLNGTSLARLDNVGESRLTKEMFEHFCATTGLSSDVLVGKDENLASLVFYIAVHAVLSVEAPLAREKVLVMLRACRQCRTHFEEMLKRSIEREDEVVLRLGRGKEDNTVNS